MNARSVVQLPARVRYFMLHLSLQTGCGTHPASCCVRVMGWQCVELWHHYTMYFSGSLLRKCMEMCPSWKWTVCQLCKNPFLHIVRDPKFHYFLHTGPPLVLVMSQNNPGHVPSYLCNINLNIIIPPTASSSKWSLSFWLSHQNPFMSCFLPYSALQGNFFKSKYAKCTFLLE